MIILVNDNNILDFDFVETESTYESERVIYQKSIIPNALIHNVELPSDFELGKYKYINNQFVLNESASDIAARKNKLIVKIDNDVDEIINKVVGKREIEYLKAEEHALAYIAANYIGTVPAFVQNWADAKNETATWAANNIAATATAWRAAQASLRANRLAKKEAARTAADIATLSTVETTWNAFIITIKQQLGIS